MGLVLLYTGLLSLAIDRACSTCSSRNIPHAYNGGCILDRCSLVRFDEGYISALNHWALYEYRRYPQWPKLECSLRPGVDSVL